jgi:hypothetical protein
MPLRIAEVVLVMAPNTDVAGIPDSREANKCYEECHDVIHRSRIVRQLASNSIRYRQEPKTLGLYRDT